MKKTSIAMIIGLTAGFSLTASAYHRSYKSDAMMPTCKDTVCIKGLSGDMTFLSNYIYRGTTVTNNLPAIQGSLTYTFKSTGIYVTLWGSNTEFPDTRGKIATVEFDGILGIANTIGNNFGYDISFNHYSYPKAAADYSELIAKASWYFLTAEVAYSSNVYNYHRNGTYYNLGFSYDIPKKYLNSHSITYNVSGGYGHYSLPRSGGLSSYNDYNLGVSATCGKYTGSLVWTDTSGSSFNLANDPDKAGRDGHLTASIIANF